MRYDDDADAFEVLLRRLLTLAGELALSEERNGELQNQLTTTDLTSANSWEGRYTNLEAALKFEKQKTAALEEDKRCLETDLNVALNKAGAYWTRIKKLEDEVKELAKPKSKPRPKTKRKR